MQINSETKIFGVVGDPLKHSFSPAMHNGAFQDAHYNGIYLPFPIKNLTGFKHAMHKFNIQGLSVTIPHKIRIRRIVDKMDPLALKIGALNTIIWNKSGLLEGFNTDGMGAVQSIQEFGFTLFNKKVLIIGVGGSARAIAFSLLEVGVHKIGVLARNRIVANVLLRSLRLQKPRIDTELLLMKKNTTTFIGGRQKVPVKVLKEASQLEDYDLIINTTPIGMQGYGEGESPLAKSFLHKKQVIFDIIYNPQKTKLICDAENKKLDVIYGYKMLLYQGVLQFKIFTGLEPNIKLMEEILLENIFSTRS